VTITWNSELLSSHAHSQCHSLHVCVFWYVAAASALVCACRRSNALGTQYEQYTSGGRLSRGQTSVSAGWQEGWTLQHYSGKDLRCARTCCVLVSRVGLCAQNTWHFPARLPCISDNVLLMGLTVYRSKSWVGKGERRNAIVGKICVVPAFRVLLWRVWLCAQSPRVLLTLTITLTLLCRSDILAVVSLRHFGCAVARRPLPLHWKISQTGKMVTIREYIKIKVDQRLDDKITRREVVNFFNDGVSDALKKYAKLWSPVLDHRIRVCEENFRTARKTLMQSTMNIVWVMI